MTAELSADTAEIRRALTLLCRVGEVYELRALNTARATVSGYYNDFEALAREAAGCSDVLKAPGVYLTVNPVRPELLARANKRLEGYAKHTTGDADIVCRRWLPIDFDPARPAGISSTDQEHEAALDRARKVREKLREMGLPEPIFADSGNGGHLLYRVEEPNDEPTRDLFRRGLEALAHLFDDDKVKVDKSTFNAARIWKLYGTVARKGDSLPERPHRLARIIEAPETLSAVTREQLEALAALAPQPAHQQSSASSQAGKSRFGLDQFLSQHPEIRVKRIDPYQGGRRIILEVCVFDRTHTGTSAAIIESPDGALGYSCLHNGCADKHWSDVRELFEPGYQERRSNLPATRNANLPAASAREPDPTVFKTAPSAPEFLRQSDGSDGSVMAGGMLARSGISLIVSPRGLGKTIFALKLAIALADGGEFCGEILPKSRVLFCAYENSPALLRDRLRRLGGAESANLRILTRSKAPKLQSEDWRAFPAELFDFIIVDSLSPALEGGIDEREGGRNSDALAALLDIVQRGPGAVFIANTTKTASSIRGSGILSDRADLIFEVRDATDFRPNPKDEVWWDGLVENQGEAAWAGRARRRRGKTTFRLALIPSKTRIGPELEPRVIELNLPADAPWTIADVTADVAGAHERSKTEAIEKRQRREDKTVAALKAALPISKGEAVELLTKNHLTRKSARQLIEGRAGAEWILAGAGTKADPYMVMGIDGENPPSANLNGEKGIQAPIFAAPVPQEGQESMFKNASGTGGSDTSNACRDIRNVPPDPPGGEQEQRDRFEA